MQINLNQFSLNDINDEKRFQSAILSLDNTAKIDPRFKKTMVKNINYNLSKQSLVMVNDQSIADYVYYLELNKMSWEYEPTFNNKTVTFYIENNNKKVIIDLNSDNTIKTYCTENEITLKEKLDTL